MNYRKLTAISGPKTVQQPTLKKGRRRRWIQNSHYSNLSCFTKVEEAAAKPPHNTQSQQSSPDLMNGSENRPTRRRSSTNSNIKNTKQTVAVETPTTALTAPKETSAAQIGGDAADETVVTPPFRTATSRSPPWKSRWAKISGCCRSQERTYVSRWVETHVIIFSKKKENVNKFPRHII